MDRSTPSFLRDLAERLRHVPGTYNIDDGDIDELIEVARTLEGNKTEADKAAKWMGGLDTGISSKTIFSVMTGHLVGWHSTPFDPADFARCSRLLDIFPAWRGRMSEVSEKYPEWAGLVDNWEQLEHLLALEAGSEGQRLWEFMKSLRDNS